MRPRPNTESGGGCPFLLQCNSSIDDNDTSYTVLVLFWCSIGWLAIVMAVGRDELRSRMRPYLERRKKELDDALLRADQSAPPPVLSLRTVLDLIVVAILLAGICATLYVEYDVNVFRYIFGVVVDALDPRLVVKPPAQ